MSKLREIVRRIIKEETTGLTNLTLQQAKQKAKEESRDDFDSVKYVNKLSNGMYEVSDRYDAKTTVYMWDLVGSDM